MSGVFFAATDAVLRVKTISAPVESTDLLALLLALTPFSHLEETQTREFASEKSWLQR
jgi:hypothetical protein